MVKNIEECTCICHRSSGVKHCVPCCFKCPECGKNIIRGMYGKHLMEHQKYGDFEDESSNK